MTNQEIFDKVYRHLMTQKRRALGASGGCVYLAPDGSKCAVGCLIPEEFYTPDIESARAEDAAKKAKYSRSQERALSEIFDAIGIGRGSAELLGALQGVHDGWFPHQWPYALERVAQEFNLTVPS